MNKPQPLDGTVHELPSDLQDSLVKNEDALKLWQKLTRLARNEFICWVEDAKQAKTRQKRIDRTIQELQEGKRRPCCWIGCVHRNDKPPSKSQKGILGL
ncbi:MAG: YdeI/OmpD-associated family protein [Acidimicrobiia bacterium]|jgi:uncharacterized protein YdeI (YjbR/CyaY-like superfamily)